MLSAFVTYAAALIFLLQASAPISKTGEKAPLPCTVSGRVVTAAEGTPLKSARVAIMLEHQGREPKAFVAISDSDGRFTIKDVPPGRYKFFATHDGFIEQEYRPSEDGPAVVLALHAGEEVKNVLFRMTLAAVINGRVNDEDGEPMVSVQVVALKKPTEEEIEERGQFDTQRQGLSTVATTQTDDRGQYRIYGLKAGEYYIKAVDNYDPSGLILNADEWSVRRVVGSQFAPVYYPGVMQVGQAQAVQVTPGEESQVDFTMRRIKTVQLSGRVIGVDGKPATDANLYLQELPAAGYEIYQGIGTDAKGEFTLKGVAPGSYMLHAGERASNDANYHASRKIDVGSDNVDSITLALGRGVNFSGQVEVSGGGTLKYDRLYVYLSSPRNDSAGAGARVKKDGTFQILDLPDGDFNLSLFDLEEDWFVKSARLGADDILTNGLTVEGHDHEGTIQIVLSKSGAQLEGSVTQDDKPKIGARVRITPDPETPYNRSRANSTTTDQTGHYSFKGVSPGQYRIVAKSSDPSGQVSAASEPQKVTLLEHDHKEIKLSVEVPQTK